MEILLLRSRRLGMVADRCVDVFRKEPRMDREHVKGAADKVKGTIKETAGKMTGDEKMQAEGKMDKAKGAVHDTAGDVKDAARDVTR